MALFLVTSSADTGAGSLRAAIEAANASAGADRIEFAAGLSGGTLALTSGELLITEELTIAGDIDGDGAGDVGIARQASADAFRIFNVSAGAAAMDGLEISGGAASYGAGVYVAADAALTLTNSTVRNNTADLGGGIYAAVASSLELAGVTLSGNNAVAGGGALIAGSGTLEAVTASGNQAGLFGGGLLLSGATTVTNATIHANSADDGGGIAISGGDHLINNATINANTARYDGGGLALLQGYATLANSIVSSNEAGGLGGAIASVQTSPPGTGLDLATVLLVANAATSNPTISGLYYGSFLSLGDPTRIFAETDPGSGAGILADNGGPVETVALLIDPSNFAIDNADATATPLDARGLPASDLPGAGVLGGPGLRDLGAFEAVEAVSLVVTLLADTVDPFDNKTSLREAINAVNAGQLAAGATVTFASGIGEAFTNGGEIDLLLGELILTQDVIIDGDVNDDGRPDIILDGQGNSRVLSIAGGEIEVAGLTLKNGAAENGAGVLVAAGAGLRLTGATITGSSADDLGGGIYNAGTVVLDQVTISGNAAGLNGGGLYNLGTAIVLNTTVAGNNVGNRGGGIYNAGTAVVGYSTITGNQADPGGGGVRQSVISGSLDLINSIILGNTSQAGGLKNEVNGPAQITGSLVSGSAAAVFAALDPATGGGALADNGGAVHTVALRADLTNPALDQAVIGALNEADVSVDLNGDGDMIDTLAPDRDGRGLLRPVDIAGTGSAGAVAADIGAYEIQLSQTDGPDILQGGADAETLAAGAGNDLIDGGLGNDDLNGGDGIDTLSYASQAAEGSIPGFGVFVDLSQQGSAQTTGAGTDTVSNFENLLGTNFNDILVGDGEANLIVAGAGRDLIAGGAGNDTLRGGAGIDVVEGGPGADSLFGGTGDEAIELDVISYTRASAALVFTFGAGVTDFEAGTSAFVLEDTFGGDFEGVLGVLDFANTFNGSALADNSLLVGGNQGDTFFGGAGQDQLIGLQGEDVIYGGAAPTRSGGMTVMMPFSVARARRTSSSSIPGTGMTRSTISRSVWTLSCSSTAVWRHAASLVSRP